MTTRMDIENGLRELGLTAGDIVLLHSSVVSLGELEGGAETVIDAFLAVLGPSGTLLAPCFGELGIVPELLKKRPGAIVSPCPVGTVVALGPEAEHLCREHWKSDSPHTEGTPYGRLAEKQGFICLLGVDQDRNTFLHGIEARLKLPYLGEISEEFIVPDGSKISKTWHYYPGPHRDFIGLDHLLHEAGVMRQRKIGSAEVRLMPAAALLDFGLRLGMKHPDFVLCDNPACADCTTQRAAIFAARIRRESFRLAASSQLAGKYVDEVMENLNAVGISWVELDNLRGRPCMNMPEDELTDIVSALQKGGIEPCSLRLHCIPENKMDFLKKISHCGIKRLVIPLLENVADFVAAARRIDLECIVFNCRSTAGQTVRQYEALNFEHPAFCFNPAEFAATGENPFLTSYKAGRFIRKTAQLDICDGKWDGSPALPGQGNGEVKELISIFRCRNFSGFMVLGGGLRGGSPFTLREFTGNFTALLDRM